MAKATLTFDLADESDRIDFMVASNAQYLHRAISDIKDVMRRLRKYHEFKSKDTEKFFSELDKEILHILAELPEELS